MSKPEQHKPGPKRLSEDEWALIRAEWESGMLPISEIARQFGFKDHSAITKRAKRKGWPERPEVSEHVRSLVTGNVPDCDKSLSQGTSARIALQSFERVLRLLQAHRQDIYALRSMIKGSLDRVAKIVEKRMAIQGPSGGLRLKDEVMIAQILSSCSNALAKLIPLERRAFGMSNDEVSEFDSFTPEQEDAVLNTIKKALA